MSVENLCDAADNGNLAEVQRLVQNGVDINGRNSDSMTALMHACIHNRVNVAIFLADHPRINLNVQDRAGATALIYAACKNRLRCAKHLLTKAAIQVNLQNKNGYTALHCCSYHNRPAIATVLLEHPKIDVTIRNDDGQTALDVAVKENHHKINSLISEKINDDFDPANLSPDEAQLLEACKNGDLQQLRQLLRTMPDLEVNVTCASNQYHALHFACKHGHHLVVKELCKHPHISLNGYDNKGRTPLHWASQRNHFQCVQALMRHRDIDYHLLNNEHKRALEVAKENSEVQKYLIQETKMTPAQQQFFGAAQAGRSSDVKNLLRTSHIPDVNLQHPTTQMTALHYACRCGHMRLLRFLLTLQSLNLEVQDEHGQTALHEACRWPDNKDIVAELLDKMSADQASIQDGDGCTAFQVALAMENTAAMTEFLECETFEAHRALLQACTHPMPKVNMHKEFLKNFMFDFIARLHKHGLVDSNAKDHLGSSVKDHVLAMLHDDAASKACLHKVLQAADTKNSPDYVLQ